MSRTSGEGKATPQLSVNLSDPESGDSDSDNNANKNQTVNLNVEEVEDLDPAEDHKVKERSVSQQNLNSNTKKGRQSQVYVKQRHFSVCVETNQVDNGWVYESSGFNRDMLDQANILASNQVENSGLGSDLLSPLSLMH